MPIQDSYHCSTKACAEPTNCAANFLQGNFNLKRRKINQIETERFHACQFCPKSILMLIASQNARTIAAHFLFRNSFVSTLEVQAKENKNFTGKLKLFSKETLTSKQSLPFSIVSNLDPCVFFIFEPTFFYSHYNPMILFYKILSLVAIWFQIQTDVRSKSIERKEEYGMFLVVWAVSQGGSSFHSYGKANHIYLKLSKC